MIALRTVAFDPAMLFRPVSSLQSLGGPVNARRNLIHSNPHSTPVPVAFLVCDQVIVDAGSGKKTIVGVFDRIWCERFPARYRPAWIYFKAIDCEGEYEHRIEYVQVSTQKILIQGKGQLVHSDRHQYAEFTLQCPPLPLTEPGEYEFRLWLNNKFVSSIRVTARLRSEMEGGP
jgi:hypothetical protein